MSQRTWIRGPVCGVDNCRSRLYTLNAGQQMCQYGHVMEGNIEIDDEGEEYVPTRRLDIHISETGTAIGLQLNAQEAQSASRFGPIAQHAYLQCLQILLRKQITRFVNYIEQDEDKRTVLSQKLTVVCKLYWVRLLASVSKKRTPYHLDIICIIYLAMIQLNYKPVYASDIIDMLTHNHLAYTKSIHLVPRELLDKLASHYFALLEPTQNPSVNWFYIKVLDVARLTRERAENNDNNENNDNDSDDDEEVTKVKIETVESIEDTAETKTETTKYLTVPTSYYTPLVFQLLSLVLLPNTSELFLMVIALNRLLGVKFYTFPLIPQQRILRQFPEVRVCASIIFVAKLYFAYRNSEPKVHPGKWLSTVEKHADQTEASFLKLDVSTMDLVHASDEKVDRYCRWIYNNLVPQKNLQDDHTEALDAQAEDHGSLSIADKRLFLIFSFDSDFTAPESPSATPESSMANYSTKDYINRVATHSLKKRVKKSTVADIVLVEELLLNRFAETLNVSTSVIQLAYAELEKQVRTYTQSA